jgi:hypothetical protein
MSDDNKYTIGDLIYHTATQEPVDFANAFNSLMLDRVNAAIEVRKNEIAQGMFDQPDDPEESDDEDDVVWEDDEEEEGE